MIEREQFQDPSLSTPVFSSDLNKEPELRRNVEEAAARVEGLNQEQIQKGIDSGVLNVALLHRVLDSWERDPNKHDAYVRLATALGFERMPDETVVSSPPSGEIAVEDTPSRSVKVGIGEKEYLVPGTELKGKHDDLLLKERARIENGAYSLNEYLFDVSEEADQQAYTETLRRALDMIIGKDVSDVRGLLEQGAVHRTVLMRLRDNLESHFFDLRDA